MQISARFFIVSLDSSLYGLGQDIDLDGVRDVDDVRLLLLLLLLLRPPLGPEAGAGLAQVQGNADLDV